MSGSNKPDSISPIDVVIAWVDGEDPEIQFQLESFIGNGRAGILPGNHETRLASVNEIRYCVLSILRFAPFVRNIFIVTNGQTPQITEEVEKLFPGRAETIKIIDHREIFRGYEKHLPTFSSRSIESMIWRIEGLSECFVYFNDDIFLVGRVVPGDWFIDGKPVLRGRWVPVPVYKIAWDLVQRSIRQFWNLLPAFLSRPSFYMAQWRSARLFGYKIKYFRNWHTPHTFRRSKMEEFFIANTGLFEKNISFRFRDHRQFSPVALANHLELREGNNQIKKPALAYLQPYGRGDRYIGNKIMQCERNRDIKFMCVQSLELCSSHQQKKLFEWMDKVLGIDDKINPNPGSVNIEKQKEIIQLN